MQTHPIVCDDGNYRLYQPLRNLFVFCRAKHTTRYAIESVHQIKSNLCATDGQKLLEVDTACLVNPIIPKGAYRVTSEGWMILMPSSGSFPNADRVWSDHKKCKAAKLALGREGYLEQAISFIFKRGTAVNVLWFSTVLRLLEDLKADEIALYVQGRTDPIEISGKILGKASFRYCQMPVNLYELDELAL